MLGNASSSQGIDSGSAQRSSSASGPGLRRAGRDPGAVHDQHHRHVACRVDAEQFAHRNRHPHLFSRLPGRGLGHRLATVHVAAGKGPQPTRRRDGAAQQQDATGVLNDGAGRHLGIGVHHLAAARANRQHLAFHAAALQRRGAAAAEPHPRRAVEMRDGGLIAHGCLRRPAAYARRPRGATVRSTQPTGSADRPRDLADGNARGRLRRIRNVDLARGTGPTSNVIVSPRQSAVAGYSRCSGNRLPGVAARAGR